MSESVNNESTEITTISESVLNESGAEGKVLAVVAKDAQSIIDKATKKSSKTVDSIKVTTLLGTQTQEEVKLDQLTGPNLVKAVDELADIGDYEYTAFVSGADSTNLEQESSKELLIYSEGVIFDDEDTEYALGIIVKLK